VSGKEKSSQLSAGLIEDEVARKIDTLLAEFNLKRQNRGLTKIPKNKLYPAVIIEYLKNKLSLIDSVPEAQTLILIEEIGEEIQKILREAYMREP
jgi:hypothetical protein